MKNKFILILITGIFFAAGLNLKGQSKEPNAESTPWIKTSDGELNDIKKVNVNNDKVTVTMDKGEKKNYTIDNVDSYFVDGKLFVKVPLYVNGARDKDVFMESVAVKEDQHLLKYREKVGDPTRYFVYKGDKLTNEVNGANKDAFEKLFNVTIAL